MSKVTKSFWEQVQKVQSQILQILEKDISVTPKEEKDVSAPTFEATTDLTSLELALSNTPRGHSDQQVRYVFQQYLPYFESGLLLETKDGHGLARAAFKKGKYYPQVEGSSTKTFSIPQITFSEIKRLTGEKLKSEFFTMELIESEDEQVICFRLQPDFLVVATSRLADVFLKAHASRIHEMSLKVLLNQIDDH